MVAKTFKSRKTEMFCELEPVSTDCFIYITLNFQTNQIIQI